MELLTEKISNHKTFCDGAIEKHPNSFLRFMTTRDTLGTFVH
jgi:hypothetical protein